MYDKKEANIVKMQSVGSSETSVTIHGVTAQRTGIFIVLPKRLFTFEISGSYCLLECDPKL
jgi:hypothetical protein